MQRSWGRKGTILAALLFLAPLGTAVGQTEIDEGTWEVGAYLINTTYDNGSLLEDSLGFGARGAYYFSEAHGIQLDLEISDTDSRESGSSTEFDLFKYAVSYVHNFRLKVEHKLAPLFTAGMGQFNVDDGTNDDTAAFFRVGGGARYTLSPRFALRFDARIWRWRGDRIVVPRDDFFSFDVVVGVSFFPGAGS